MCKTDLTPKSVNENFKNYSFYLMPPRIDKLKLQTFQEIMCS